MAPLPVVVVGPFCASEGVTDGAHRAAMTEWYRQHRESLLWRMPWHLPSPEPTPLRVIGGYLAACGTMTSAEDRGIDRMEDPLLDDRCPVCQGEWMAGRAG